MPRDGSLTLSDIRGPTLTIVCEPCGRRCGPAVLTRESFGEIGATYLLFLGVNYRKHVIARLG
jgi:hypothetical protein